MLGQECCWSQPLPGLSETCQLSDAKVVLLTRWDSPALRRAHQSTMFPMPLPESLWVCVSYPPCRASLCEEVVSMSGSQRLCV